MKNRLFLTLASLLVGALGAQAAKTVTSEQAKLVGDGVTLNTQAIQNTIDQLSAKGGGTFVITAGRYVTGAIEMKSNVELRLDKDAVLLGSTWPNDYLVTVIDGKPCTPDPTRVNALIYANAAQNIKITGEGTVDGRGRELVANIDSLNHRAGRRVGYDNGGQIPHGRPKLVFLMKCHNVEVTGPTFTSSANWGLSFKECEDMYLHHLKVVNRAYWNNDGIDLTDCRRVEVAYSHVNSADDGICLKSENAQVKCDSIYVHDCDVASSASALKFGTASLGGFTNIHFARIKVYDTFRSAIAIEGVDGGTLNNILMEDIDAFSVGNPIYIRLGNRKGQPGTVSGITIRRMYCDMAFERPDEGYDVRGPITNTMINPLPSSITGIPGHPVKDITIEEVLLVYPGDASKGLHYIPTWNLDRIPEVEKGYPEFDKFGELPSYGFFVRHADGITFRNVQIKLKKDDFRPAFVLDDAKNVKFEHVTYPLGKTSGQIYDSTGVNKQ